MNIYEKMKKLNYISFRKVIVMSFIEILKSNRKCYFAVEMEIKGKTTVITWSDTVMPYTNLISLFHIKPTSVRMIV